jgi:hypothetical protein
MAMRTALCLLIVLSVVGCSSDSLQRTGYEAVGNAGRRDCMKDPGSSYDQCRNRQSYDDYQRSRKGEG